MRLIPRAAEALLDAVAVGQHGVCAGGRVDARLPQRRTSAWWHSPQNSASHATLGRGPACCAQLGWAGRSRVTTAASCWAICTASAVGADGWTAPPPSESPPLASTAQEASLIGDRDEEIVRVEALRRGGGHGREVVGQADVADLRVLRRIRRPAGIEQTQARRSEPVQVASSARHPVLVRGRERALVRVGAEEEGALQAGPELRGHGVCADDQDGSAV